MPSIDIDYKEIKEKAVTTAKLDDLSVTTAKIANANVTVDKLASGAVTTDKIADGTITATDIANSAVTTDKINTSAVTSNKIADGTIVNADIANGTIEAPKLKGGATVGNVLTTSTANAAPTWAKPVITVDGWSAKVYDTDSGGYNKLLTFTMPDCRWATKEKFQLYILAAQDDDFMGNADVIWLDTTGLHVDKLATVTQGNPFSGYVVGSETATTGTTIGATYVIWGVRNSTQPRRFRSLLLYYSFYLGDYTINNSGNVQTLPTYTWSANIPTS